MNTGHDGSMTTAHSNGPRDTLSRLETMVMMAGMELPIKAIREQISSAIDLVVHQDRMRDGSRKIVNITEVTGMEGDVITMTDVFVFDLTGYENGKVGEGFVWVSPEIYGKLTPHAPLTASIFGTENGAGISE
jgi:pilus assembly protein CpaF